MGQDHPHLENSHWLSRGGMIEAINNAVRRRIYEKAQQRDDAERSVSNELSPRLGLAASCRGLAVTGSRHARVLSFLKKLNAS